MNLLNPGPGDLLDRLTILARKVVERPERLDFRKEFEEVAEKAFLDDARLHAGKRALILAALNAALWQREDKLRDLTHHTLSTRDDGSDVAAAGWAVAKEIQDLNDRRAALVAEINGQESEKLYK